jgi:hypothetical protein
VSWLCFSEEGYSRDELLQLFALTREQRNQHRTAIFDVLQFYSTLVAGLFAAELTLCTFAIPYILTNVKQPNERAALFFFLSLLPLAILFLIYFALINARKEYEKLIEHLTVEQKLETALGMMQPIQIKSQPAGPVPYPSDMALLYQRWIDGRMGFDRSVDFVASTVARTEGGFFAPLRRSLLVIGITDALLLSAVAIWGVILLF